MNWLQAIHFWWIDCQMAAAVLLLVSFLVCQRLKEPIQRVKVARLTMTAILAFMILAALPGWPRLRLGILPEGSTTQVAGTAAVVPATMAPPLLVSQSSATNKPTPTVTLSSQVSTSLSLPMPTATSQLASSASRDRFLYVVKFVYWTATLGLVAWLAIGLILMKWLRRSSRTAPQAVQELLQRIPDRPIHCPVAVGVSSRIEQPLAFGLCRPMILLPTHMVREGTEEEILSALSHEWCHIRRWDLWSKLLNRWLFAWYFCNPCFWWLSRQLHLDQEVLADRDASEIVTPVEYAAILLNWARRRVAAVVVPATSMSLQASVLKHRILVLLDGQGPVQSQVQRCWNLSATSLAVATALLISFCSLQSPQLDRGNFATVVERPPQQAEPLEPIRVTLANGFVIEVVGVLGETGQGWQPDGRDDPTILAGSDSQCTPRELLVRVYHPSKSAQVVSTVAMQDGVHTYFAPSADGSSSDAKRIIRVPLPAGQRTVDIRFAVESGPWSHYMSSGCDIFQELGDVSFSVCGDDAANTLVTVGHNRPHQALRLLAVDRFGTEHSSSSTRFDNNELTATFDDLPLPQVQEFVLQTRPVTYVELRNISLRAGLKSEFQVVKPTQAQGIGYRPT